MVYCKPASLRTAWTDSPHNRLRDEAILRAQDGACLRKPAHTLAGLPFLGESTSLDKGPCEQPRRSVTALTSTSNRADHKRESGMPDLIWIIVIVLVVLLVLGYFGRGRFRR